MFLYCETPTEFTPFLAPAPVVACSSGWLYLSAEDLALTVQQNTTSPYPQLTQSDFYTLGGFTVSIFLLAFGIKMIRKTLSVDVSRH